MHYLAAEKPAALNIPSFTELILRDDLAKVKNFLQQDPHARILVAPNAMSSPADEQIMDLLRKEHRLESKGPGNRIYLFGPRNVPLHRETQSLSQ